MRQPFDPAKRQSPENAEDNEKQQLKIKLDEYFFFQTNKTKNLIGKTFFSAKQN